jgi:hypothetical protein
MPSLIQLQMTEARSSLLMGQVELGRRSSITQFATNFEVMEISFSVLRTRESLPSFCQVVGQLTPHSKSRSMSSPIPSATSASRLTMHTSCELQRQSFGMRSVHSTATVSRLLIEPCETCGTAINHLVGLQSYWGGLSADPPCSTPGLSRRGCRCHTYQVKAVGYQQSPPPSA